MKSNPASFLVAFMAAGVTLCLGVALFNVVVDPFQIFGFVSIQGFNAQRLKAASEARMMKAIQVCLRKPTAVLMGTSRVEVGMDPRHPGWKPGESAYSLALAGTGLAELDMTFRHLVHASPDVKQVAIGLDFLMFNAHREAHVFGTEVLGFEPRRLLIEPGDTCLRSLSTDAWRVLGVPALKYSVATILSQMPAPDATASNYNGPMVNAWRAQYDEKGYRGGFYSAFVPLAATRDSAISYYNEMAKAIEETYYVNKVWRPSPEKRYCFAREGVDTFQTFRSMVDFAYQSGVDVRLFINPIHAHLLVALREAGLWPTYEAWKRGLARVVEEEGRRLGRAPLPLWDFSGFNAVTTEAVPRPDAPSQQMRYWWEPSHYQSVTGAMMLDRILDYHDPRRVVPEDFGARLDSATIDSWIERTRRGALAYAAAQPDEVRIVTDAVDRAMAGEEGADCGDDVQALYEGAKARDAGDPATAEAAFDRGVALHEAQRRLYAEIDAPFREAGFYPLLARIRAGDKIAPRLGSAVEYQTRAQARLDAGDFDAAIEDFTQAYKITPYNDVLKYLIGYAHEKRGEQRLAQENLPGAEDDFTATMASWSAKPQASLYFLRGSTRLRLGKEDGALADFNDGLALDPGNKTLIALRDRARSVLASRQK